MMDQMERLDDRLDELEDRLPGLPAAGLRMQRAVAARSCSLFADVARAWWESVGGTTERANVAARTVGGTSRAAGEQAADAAATAARRVAGQTGAQVREVVDRAEQELGDALRTTEDLAERAVADATNAIDAVTVAADPDRTPTGDAYEDLSKRELYRRATSHEIAGRSKMSKSELIEALIAAETTAHTDSV